MQKRYMDVKNKSPKMLLSSLFILMLMTVVATFHHLNPGLYPTLIYALFTYLLLSAYFSEQFNFSVRYRQIASLISVILIVFSGLVYVNDLEKIEEMYLLIPLLYLFILPGTLWPIAIAFSLLTAYIPSLDAYGWFDNLEDSLELIVITSFASIMSFFQQKSLKQMRHFRDESYTDYLTRLPNRNKLMTQMYDLKTYQSENNDSYFALLIIDLDGFKKINDRLGHPVGDSVLRMVANRLQALVSKSCIAYRLGGDEFAFIVTANTDLQVESAELAEKVIAFAKKPYVINNKNYYISSSIGIASFPNDGDDLEMLSSNADLAMYKAKELGKNQFSFYDPKQMQKTVRRYELEDELKNAIANGQLHVHYQPKVSLITGEIVSAEALLRWSHPKYGMISPVEFIPIAEQCQLIIPIGYWVLEQVCQQIVKWEAYSSLQSVAVNVSSLQLSAPNFVVNVNSILEKTLCPSVKLELEQTESWVMDDPDNNIEVLKQLKRLGVILSLDDFGTAYSSLSQLGRLPFDILKIDKSFIDNCVHNQDDHMIVRTIIQLGKNLGMMIVAEGVEYKEQRELLAAEGCEFYQGYLFSKPVSATEFTQLLEHKKQ